MTSRTPIPFVPHPPRDGEFVQTYPDSGKVKVQGTHKNGLKTGSWKAFHPNGAIESDYEWEHGIQHGHELDWTAEGQQICQGQNVRGKRSGRWTWWYPNGELQHFYNYEDGKRHGIYEWNQEDGKPRARGEFHADQYHGEWTWWNEPNAARIERSYWHGQFDGKDIHYGPDDTVLRRAHYQLGHMHGLEEAFYPDGKPRFKGNWRLGIAVGEHHSWEPDGTLTTTVFEDGLVAANPALTPKKLESLVKKLKKAKDSYKKNDALSSLVDYGQTGPLVVKLWREGIYDVARDADLWEELVRTRGVLSSKEVMDFLKVAENPDDGPHLPYWSRHLDALTMWAYSQDPSPFDEGWQELPVHTRKGVAFVMARFGKDVGNALKDELEALLIKHTQRYGLDASCLWWEDGRVQEVKLFTDHIGTRTDYFAKFLSFFTTEEAWREGLKRHARKEIEHSVSRFSFRTFRDLVNGASEEEMMTYLGAISLDGDTHILIQSALTEWNAYDADALERIALGIQDDGLRKWPALCCAVLQFAAEGRDVPDSLADVFLLDAETPTYSSDWYNQPLRTLDEKVRNTPSYVANFVPFGIGCSVPRSEWIHAALAEMSDEQVKDIFERYLVSDYAKGYVAPYAYRLPDPDLWRRVLDVIEKDTYGATPRYTWEFAGNIGVEAIPFVEESMARADKKLKASWEQSIIVALAKTAASLAEDGQVLPDTWDKYIKATVIPDGYDGKFLIPFLARLIHLLPEERAEPILLEAIASTHFEYVLGMLGSHPTKAVLEAGFNRLLEKEATLSWDAKSSVTTLVQSLPNPEAWIRWVFANGGGGGIKDQLGRAINNYIRLEELIAEATQGKEAPKKLDAIDKLLALVEGTTEGERLYVLRRRDEPVDESLNLIGGLPPGTGAENWPTRGRVCPLNPTWYEDEPMTHLFTLDLKTMPELRKNYKKARAISVFCFQPDHNEAWEADTDWTAVRLVTQAEIDSQPAPPEDLELMEPAYFEVIEALIPFKENDAIRKAVYGVGARVGGEPIWLQSDEGFGDFVMQFDESFVHMNLGDAGIMYVFGDTAFWQCH